MKLFLLCLQRQQFVPNIITTNGLCTTPSSDAALHALMLWTYAL